MPETEKFLAFKATLFRHCAKVGIPAGEWRSRSNRLGHVLDFGGGNNSLLYVKDSRLNIGWWGLNQKVYAALRDSGRNWRVALLVRDSEEGYLLTSSQVDTIIPGASQNKDSYIVHERDAGAGVTFRSFAELFARLGL